MSTRITAQVHHRSLAAGIYVVSESWLKIFCIFALLGFFPMIFQFICMLQIVECRRVLKWTYSYGFYLPEHEHAKRQFFEYLQGLTSAFWNILILLFGSHSDHTSIIHRWSRVRTRKTSSVCREGTSGLPECWQST